MPAVARMPSAIELETASSARTSPATAAVSARRRSVSIRTAQRFVLLARRLNNCPACRICGNEHHTVDTRKPEVQRRILDIARGVGCPLCSISSALVARRRGVGHDATAGGTSGAWP